MNRNVVRLVTAAAFAGFTIIAAKAFPLPQQYSVQNFQAGPITLSAGGPNQLAVLSSMLGLTASQQDQVKAVLDEEAAASKALLEQLKQASESLMSAQKTGAPDAEIDRFASNLADVSSDILALDAKAQSKNLWSAKRRAEGKGRTVGASLFRSFRSLASSWGREFLNLW